MQNNILLLVGLNVGVFSMFYILYTTFFSKLTHYSWNRGFLVISAFLSLAIPLFTVFVNLDISGTENTVINELEKVTFKMEAFEFIEGMSQGNLINTNQTYSWWSIIIALYSTGGLFFLIRMLREFYSVSLLIRENTLYKNDGYKLIILKHSIPTFSFFNCVFINENDWERNEEELHQILSHELVHVQNRHSWDILLFEIINIIIWFNPFIYLYKRIIRQVHEFQADYDASIPEGAYNYSKLLVKLAATQQNLSLVSNFSKKQLKRRIVMLNTLKSRKMAKIRYILFVPVVLSMVVMSCMISPVDGQDITSAESKVSEVELNENIPSIFPVEKGDNVKITLRFEKAMHPIKKKEFFHKGLDIKAPKGTPVYATASGTVYEIKESTKGYGNRIALYHGDKLFTLFAHLSVFNVEKDQEVKKGDIIGYVGNTGVSTAPHLHYEVIKDDNNVDPMLYIQD